MAKYFTVVLKLNLRLPSAKKISSKPKKQQSSVILTNLPVNEYKYIPK